MLQHANTRSNSSAPVAGARAFAAAAVVAITKASRYSRWFDMQAGVAKYSKDFTKRPVKGLLGIQT